MNDVDQENEALEGPVIFNIPDSLTVPGFGFLVALNTHWCFEGINSGDDSLQTRRRQVCRSVSKVYDGSWRGSWTALAAELGKANALFLTF